MASDPGRTAYEARFAGEKQGPRGAVDPWETLPDEVRAIWRRVEEACRAAGVQQEADERAAICRELGCIDKPGVPLKFVQDLRRQIAEANRRNGDLIRSWDPATPTERQELDRMRRGWGPSSPTERERRRQDVAACLSALSIAMSDLCVSEDEAEDVPEEARDRLDEAYERVSKQHTALVEILHKLVADPQQWPDIKAAEERGAAEALAALGAAPAVVAVAAKPEG